MSTIDYRFLEPLDVLILRGNKLFGDPGSFGESLVPPWPSVAAGALRSRMLADKGLDWNPARRREAVPEDPELGTPDKPGSFTITAFHLARRFAEGTVKTLIAPPADLVITRQKDEPPHIRTMQPTRLSTSLESSYPLPLHPVLAESERTKPVSGYWLTQEGWRIYLAGQTPGPQHFVESSKLWSLDTRVGVGLDGTKRAAAEGQLFTVQAVAMTKRAASDGFDTGFLVGVVGAHPPTNGMVRLGGDGRAAAVHEVNGWQTPEPDYTAMVKARRCRLILTSPGIFANGWLPTGTTKINGEYRVNLHDVRGRLVCAVVPRHDVVSGWDLAKWQPKPAQRAAPTGSVYWLELDDGVTEGNLRTLVERGLWSEPCEDSARRAEGFNRCTLATWTEEAA